MMRTLHGIHRPVQILGRRLLDLVFPPTCVGCHRPGQLLCPACAQRVEPVPATVCSRCGRIQARAVPTCPHCEDEEPALQRVGAAALHLAPLREAIHELKYGGQPGLAEPLARYLVAAFAGPAWRTLGVQMDAVVPVPLHQERRRERGYNQSELLAGHFCAATGIPLQPSWLQRVRLTRPQVGLNAQERRANVEDAFTADPRVRGQTLLLMDDVYTTGATLRACAAAALDAGAHAVYGLTLAIPAHDAALHPARAG
jgi:ComF family protein